jgi:transposase
MSGYATAGCCSSGPIRVRPGRWCWTRTLAPLPSSRGTYTRGIHDDMKKAVETVFIGRDRQYNRLFLRMRGHYLVEPVACTRPRAGRRGQVENQVGVVRDCFFTPRLRVTSYEELNGFLLDRRIAEARAHRHPEFADRTIR